MTGESFGAAEAREMGLVATVAEDAFTEAMAIAEKIAALDVVYRRLREVDWQVRLYRAAGQRGEARECRLDIVRRQAVRQPFVPHPEDEREGAVRCL